MSIRAAVLLVSLLASGCYASHERGRTDAGPVDAGCAPIGTMVDIDGPHPYRIETTEVTQAAYARFLRCGATVEATPSCPSTTLMPVDHLGDGSDPELFPFEPETEPDLPVRGVSWCAATAYCAWAGRRLCTREEWVAVCLSTEARMALPGGRVTDTRACVLSSYADGEWGTERGIDMTQPVRSAPTCRGLEPPFDEVFDMVGNVNELVNVDDRAEPSRIYGSAYDYGPSTGCTNETWISPSQTRQTAGFRCCDD